MAEATYRTGAAARLLKVSNHRLRRLCESGLIKAVMDGAGQWRIPASEVHRLQAEGVPPAPRVNDEEPEESSGAAVSERNESAGLENELPARRLDLARPRLNYQESGSPKVKRANDAVAITAARVERRRLQLSEVDLDNQLATRQQRQAAEREAEAAKKARAGWLLEIQNAVVSRLPKDCPSGVRIALPAEIDKALRPYDHTSPSGIVAPLVKDLVCELLAPYYRKKEVERLIREGVALLPREARNVFSTPTVWQVKAERQARAAIAKLPPDADLRYIEVTITDAVTPVVAECQFELDKAEWLKMPLGYWVYDLTQEEQKAAMAAVLKALNGLTPPVSREELQSARDAALAPFKTLAAQRKQEKDKEHAALIQNLFRLKHTPAQEQRAERLVDEALSNELPRILRKGWEWESYTERRDTQRTLAAQLRPVLVKELLSGVLDEDDISARLETLTEEAIDDA